jgi:hypothetical protein
MIWTSPRQARKLLITRRWGHCRRLRIKRRPDGSSTGCGRTEPWRFSHLPGNKDRRFRVNNVLLLAEGRDRRPGGTSAIRCALRAERHQNLDQASDQVEIYPQALTPFEALAADRFKAE